MSTEEKHTWFYAIASPIIYLVYLGVIIYRAQGVPIAEVAYVGPMLWALGLVIGTAILSRIALAIIWQKDERHSPDERDRQVNRFGDKVGLTIGSLASLAGLILALVEADYFWIANVIFLGCTLAGFTGSLAKIYAYRQGVPR